METVKVDLEKLQILNDRIAQTIDALNQVRLTTHGLQHSGHAGQQFGGQQPFGGQQFGGQQFGGQQVGGQQVGGQQVGGQQVGGQQVGGQPFVGHPYAQQGYLPPGMMSGLPQQSAQVPSMGAGQQSDPYWQQRSLAAMSGYGISHTGAWNDPYLRIRALQTFPFATSPFPAGY